MSAWHPAVISFEEQQKRFETKAETATILFEAYGAWRLDTIWERPEIWIPVCRPDVTQCSRAWHESISSTAFPATRTYCHRRWGHGGRCAAYGHTDHTGTLRRVVAVWPSAR